MAFSLEAALVVPLVISTWIGFSMAVIPTGELTRLAAALEMRATGYSLENRHLYRAECLQDDTVWTTALQTSPQAALELFTLIRDDCQLISRSFSGLFTEGGQAAGDGS